MHRAAARTWWCAGLCHGLLALVLAPACQEDDEVDPDAWWKGDYSFVHEGEQVTVYGYDLAEADACAGSFDALEVHTRSVMELLGVEQPAQFDYRWISNDFWPLLERTAGAFTRHGVPYSRTLPDMHEIVHMISWRLPGHGCTSLLEEGLATYLGAARFEDLTPSKYTVRELMTTTEHPGPEGYGRAAQFVSFLLEKYGPEGYLRLCAAYPNDEKLASWDAAIRQSLGKTLDELLAEFDDYPKCSVQQLRARLWECDREPDFVASDDNRLFEVKAGCSDPTVTNASRPWDRGDAMLTRLIYLPTKAWIQVSTYAPHDETYAIQQCGPCSEQPEVVRDLNHRVGNHHVLPAGLHEVIVFFDKRDTVSLRIRVMDLWDD